MAKMFYTMEEAREKLGRNEDEVKQLVKDGLLREFRDGARIMFKVDDVDNLVAGGLSSTGSGLISLAPEDSADQLGLTPSDTAEDLGLPDTGMDLGLTPDQAGGSGTMDLSATDAAELISLAPSDSADHVSLDDTSQAQDKDDTVVTSHGINVLDDSDSEIEMIDPMAQTQMAPDLDDQVDIDSGSSGSGLLDLSREADDTSLGAELLEEIYPGSEGEHAVETQVPGGLEMAAEISNVTAAEAQAPPLMEYVAIAQVDDPTSGAYGAMMVVPLLALILLGCIAASQSAGVYPNFVAGLSGLVWYIIGGAAALALIIAGVGAMITGRSGAPAALDAPKPKKAKKEKKKKEKKAKKK
jgi:hypothetical protein